MKYATYVSYFSSLLLTFTSYQVSAVVYIISVYFDSRNIFMHS